jgi:hypothetical protein
MGKAFTKGQEVTQIADWDRKGTVTFRHAVVYSCGAKQMVLTDAETGEEMGRNFRPVVGEVCGTFPRMTDEEARAACLRAAEAILDYERAHYNRCLSGGHSEAYNASVRKDLAALHEPRAISYGEAHAAVVAAVRNQAA